jgi:hypothetical protein
LTDPAFDIHGVAIQGPESLHHGDQFAIASLAKSLTLHQSTLSVPDEERVHGEQQGMLLMLSEGHDDAAGRDVARRVVRYFLNELPWSHLSEGEPADVSFALEEALLHATSDVRGRGEETLPGLTLAFVLWPHLYCVQLGEGRAYLLRGHSLRELAAPPPSQPSTAERRSWTALLGRWGRQRASRARGPRFTHLELRPGDVVALVNEGVRRSMGLAHLRESLDRPASAEELCDSIADMSSSVDRSAIVARVPRSERDPVALGLSPDGRLEQRPEEPRPTGHGAVRPSPWPAAGSRDRRGPGAPLPARRLTGSRFRDSRLPGRGAGE